MTTTAVGLGAAGIILAAATFPVIAKLLTTRICQFLGKTSYSFYLVHMPMLMAVGAVVFKVTGSYSLTWIISLVASYGVSALLFRFVEAPGMRLGSSFSRSLAERWEARAAALAPDRRPDCHS